jgi:glycosyltransferase involved in cell wall biosynthesis
MGDSLVSVVVPTYNKPYCLERSVSSALSQTHRNLEIVMFAM